MIKRLIIFFSIYLTCCTLHAQNVEFKKEFFDGKKDQLRKALDSIKVGDKIFAEGTYFYKQALPYYLSANKINPNNALLNFKIGHCYLYSNFKMLALSYLKKAAELKPDVDPELGFLTARAYHLNLDWENAIKEYEKYRALLDGSTDNGADRIAEINRRIGECKNGMEYVKNPIRVFIDNVGPEINTPYSEYGPIISADEGVMIFTSRRPNTTGGLMDEVQNEYMEDLYISTRVNNKWSTAQNMGSPVNSEKHDATVNLTPDGQTLFMYRDENNGDIFECTLKGDKWSKPERIKNINTSAHETTASLSFDGKILYFVSDRIGGLGDRDIYYSVKDEKGRWGKPINLGAPINTPYGEEGVFMMPDGQTMYFSSQGHKTMGGYDIFKSVLVNGKWSTPINIGYPVNSADDDVFLTLSASGKHGYYSSIKADGYGEKDIYRITFMGPEKKLILNNEDNLIASVAAPVKETVIAPAMEIKTAQITILKGVITDAFTKKPLEAEIELIDNTENKVIATFTSNSSTGKYLVSLPAGKNYGIAVKKTDYLFHSENFDIPQSASYQEVVKDVQLKNIAVGTKIVLKNIFFDFNKATLRKESTNELERLIQLLNDIPSMRIEISGHTDSRGSDDFNQKLSESRSKAVVDYLISHGIKQDRLEFAGYGEIQPMATNDTDEGRQLNRRTEFKILSK